MYMLSCMRERNATYAWVELYKSTGHIVKTTPKLAKYRYIKVTDIDIDPAFNMPSVDTYYGMRIFKQHTQILNPSRLPTNKLTQSFTLI